MTTTRPAAVAGMFYSAQPAQLQHDVHQYLAQADMSKLPTIKPKAIIVPHAGYVYSAPIAATAYNTLRPLRQQIKKVVLLGPAHRVPFCGLAAPSSDFFMTPLGQIKIDRDAIQRIRVLPQVITLDAAHAQEHSLEVQLPFLQSVLDDFELIPLVVGDADKQAVADVLNLLWGGDETLIVISSDLSHYHHYDVAQQMDRATSLAIEKQQPENIDYDRACGRNPVNGLLSVAQQKNLHIKTLDLRNSGDTAGDKNRVVGYGAYVCYP